MEVIFFVLCLLSSAVSFSTSDLSLPGDDLPCVNATRACYYSGQRSQIFSLLHQHPPRLHEACSLFGQSFSCINATSKSNADCLNATSYVQELEMQAKHDMDGICYSDGGVSPCARKASLCKIIYDKTVNALKQMNETKACRLGEELGQCIDASLASCPIQEQEYLTDQKDDIYLDDLIRGCDGPCGLAVSACYHQVQNDTQGVGVDDATLCKDMKQAELCTDALHETDCKNETMVDDFIYSWTRRLEGKCNSGPLTTEMSVLGLLVSTIAAIGMRNL